MTVSFHKYGDKFFPGTGDMKVHFIAAFFFLFFFAKFHCYPSDKKTHFVE